MANTEIEVEVNHFWVGTGTYRDFSGEHIGRRREAVAKFLERNIVVPRGETCDGEVTDHGDYASAGSGPESASGSISDNPNWLRNRAVNLLSIADYIENRDAILAAKEAEALAYRNQRRDELAREFTAVNSYSGQLPYTQNLINRIIELEGAAK